MRVVVVFLGVLAVAAAASLPAKQLLSKSMVRESPPGLAPLFFGTFFTRQDHTRPQNRVLATFVSSIFILHYPK